MLHNHGNSMIDSTAYVLIRRKTISMHRILTYLHQSYLTSALFFIDEKLYTDESEAVPVHTMKAYMANISTAPFILKLSNGWRSVVSFMVQPLYCQRRNPGTHWTGLVGATGGLGISKRQKYLGPAVNTLTTLSQLLSTSCSKKTGCSSCKKHW